MVFQLKYRFYFLCAFYTRKESQTHSFEYRATFYVPILIFDHQLKRYFTIQDRTEPIKSITDIIETDLQFQYSLSDPISIDMLIIQRIEGKEIGLLYVLKKNINKCLQ